MAAKTNNVTLPKDIWTPVSAGQGNVLVQLNNSRVAVRIAIADTANELGPDVGHILDKGAIPFYGISGNVYARPVGSTASSVAVTAW